MKKINLLPFFDLYAGTWNQQGLFNEIRTVYPEADSINVINKIGRLMLSVGTPQGINLDTDCVLERLRSNQYDADLILDWYSDRDGNLGDRKHGYQSCWAGDGYQIAFKHRYPDPTSGALEKYYDPAPNLNDHFQVITKTNLQEPPAGNINKLREIVDQELGEGALFKMMPWLNPATTGEEQNQWAREKSSTQLAERDLPRKGLSDADRLDGHYADWIANFVSFQLPALLPHFAGSCLSARMIEAIVGVSNRINWLSHRLDLYERAFGCEDMTADDLKSAQSHTAADDGTGNRSKAQFDEPDEPSLFVEGDDEKLNPLWVLYTTNYHRGLLTQEQVENVGNNLLKQLQQCSKERLQEIGPRGIPNVLTKFGHVSMAWVIHFKNAHQPDLNFGQITRLGHTVAEQVKAYKPRG